MRVHTVMIALVLPGMLPGCGLFDSGRLWRSSAFEVLWIDLPSNSHLAYRIDSTPTTEVVGACITAAEGNDQYAVVKRMGRVGEGYYVIAKDSYASSATPAAAITGPLSEAALRGYKANSPLPALTDVLPAAACDTAG